MIFQFFLFNFIFFFNLIISQVCEVVYPHLSCGLSYNTKEECESIGCCWDSNSYSLNNCFVPKINGYSFTQTLVTETTTTGTLNLIQPSGAFGPDYTTLDISFIQESASRTHIKINPTGTKPWEVPETLIPRPGGQYSKKNADSMVQYLSSGPTEPLEFVISRQNNGVSTGELIFIFTKMLVFQDQYIQFVLGTPTDTVATFGIGESTRLTQHLQVNTTYTLWNSDYLAAFQNSSLYGSHPFFIQISNTGKAHGVLLLNSNAMDVSVSYSSTQGGTLGYQVTGGLIDLYIFSGPTPSDVIYQYLEVIGKPVMMPYWSLGFHNCRYGYPSVAYVQDVVTNYSIAKIPLETQWMDIDYMDKYLDFTLDPVLFSPTDMTTFVNNLHTNNQKFVPIIDPGIYVRDDTYPAYTKGLEQNVFINDMTNSKPYLGQVWPGPTYFPDWFAENATSWWSDELVEFHNLVEYDGLWIDMNEVSNFCNVDGNDQICVMNASNPCDSTTCCLICSTIDSTNKYDFPPFVPHVSQGSLSGKTLSMNSYHAGDILEYNAHNLYGLMESVATQTALHNARPGKRAFMVTRSTYPSSGVYAAHWTGDNNSSWVDLRESIITMNNLALFGIPMVGADICGFLGNTNEELCARWIEVGAFSPFSRNHNGLGQIPQELYRWDSVATASRAVLGLKYQLLPYLYTLLYKAHISGSTVMNAMWVHFPTDEETFFCDGQYMWSNGILFTPVITRGATAVTGYFPKGLWYSLFDSGFIDSSNGGQPVLLVTPLENTNVHGRGGTILTLQNTDNSAMTTTDARKTPFTLLVLLDENSESEGSLYLDDGEQITLDSFSFITYNAIPTQQESDDDYNIAGGLIQSSVAANLYQSSQIINAIKIKGVSSKQGDVSSLPDVCTSSIVYNGNTVLLIPLLTNYDSYSEFVVKFDDLDLNIVSDFVFSWQCRSNKDSKSNDNDDDEGWDSIPAYGQALIICTIILVVIGLIFFGYRYYYLHTKKNLNDPLLPSNEHPAQLSMKG